MEAQSGGPAPEFEGPRGCFILASFLAASRTASGRSTFLPIDVKIRAQCPDPIWVVRWLLPRTRLRGLCWWEGDLPTV